MNTGNAAPASMELKETNLVKYKTMRKTPVQASAVQGEIPITIPNSVATPFPPLKLAQIGKIWPKTAEHG